MNVTLVGSSLGCGVSCGNPPASIIFSGILGYQPGAELVATGWRILEQNHSHLTFVMPAGQGDDVSFRVSVRPFMLRFNLSRHLFT